MVKLAGTTVVVTTISLNGLASPDGWIGDVQVYFMTGLAKIGSLIGRRFSSLGVWLAKMLSQRMMKAVSAEKSTSLAVACRPYAAFAASNAPRPQH